MAPDIFSVVNVSDNAPSAAYIGEGQLFSPGKGIHMINAVQSLPPPNAQRGAFYTLFVDDREFHVDESTITGGQIMDLAGIPREAGLLLIDEDGSQKQVGADEIIELKPGRRFKKAPRFKRG